MGLMWTPIILYDLFGGRYLMWVPSVNEIKWICSCSMVRFLWLRGLPCPQSDPVASHFDVSSWMEPGVLADDVQFFELDFEVLDSLGRDAHVIFVAIVVVGDDCGGRFLGLVCGFITSASHI